jgi:hypothetical protein
MATRYKTVTRRTTPVIPGLQETSANSTAVVSFVPKPTTWQQTGIKLGRWFVPLGKWTLPKAS